MAYFLGIDIGTTGAKTVLIDENGTPIARTSTEYELDIPQPGWVEQNPEDWWTATVNNVKTIISGSGISPGEIKGIGLSGQMHGSVFLDKDDNVIRPAILWCDQRTGRECDLISGKIGKSRLIELTCNPALTGFTLPKILWLKDNEPENYEKVRKVLLPKDYIRLKLTGEHATEVSDASGTLMFDVVNRKWSDELIGALDIDREWLPRCYESIEISGKISWSAAEALDLNEGIPVAGGGGDQAAGAVGNGIVEQGIISATLGTSGVVFAHCEEPVMDPEGRLHTFCHAVPGKWHIMGVMLSAGGSFRWLRDTLCNEEVLEAQLNRSDPYEIMTNSAEKVRIGSEGLIFLPYLTGERTPYPNPKARGGFIGLTVRHKKDHMIRSVMEGVTFGMNDSLKLIRDMKVSIKQIRMSGGGSRSELWRRMQADIYNSETAVINVDEGPAFGAALIAAVGCGHFNSIEEACRNSIKIQNNYTPNAENVEIYRDYYGIYSSLYKKLKMTFSELSDISTG
ncbi:MAG: xylulokinase [bacterium]|nr:xylulokinase [bacterium]